MLKHARDEIYDFNSSISAKITIFSDANPVQVARRCIATNIWSQRYPLFQYILNKVIQVIAITNRTSLISDI